MTKEIVRVSAVSLLKHMVVKRSEISIVALG